MKSDKRSDYVTRDDILKLLSDEEVARVSTAETAARLADGEEYLDLEHLGQGVCTAHGAGTPLGSALPRKAVNPETWTKILAQLAGDRARTSPKDATHDSSRSR